MTGRIDAVLLAGFGGPEGVEEVVPFLERVTAGRGIPPERLLEVGQHYIALGGVSPLNEQNRQLAAALQAELDARGLSLPVRLGNRNSAPFFADVVASLHADGHRNLLAVATSAYSSYSGCRQYREDLAGALADSGVADSGVGDSGVGDSGGGDAVVITKVRPYGSLDGFTLAMADGLRNAISRARHSGSELHVFFTTHSIPDSMAAAAGPGGTGAYVAQHLDVAERILADVFRPHDADPAGESKPAWSLVYQSRSGPPQVPWLEPDINDALREASDNGVREVIVVPIGFISDHIEVVWDLDTQARATADGLGLVFQRVATAGCDPRFVSGLADLVVRAAAPSDEPGVASVWGGTCSTDCCLNPRSNRDVVPGA